MGAPLRRCADSPPPAQPALEARPQLPCKCEKERVGPTRAAPPAFALGARQFAARVGYSNIMFVHVSLVPVLGSVGEQKG